MCDADFNEEFRDDIEVEETIDALLEALKEQAEEADGQVRVNNPDKVKEILGAFKIMKHLVGNKKNRVTYKLNSPFRETGSVSVAGRNIVFDNPDPFIRIAKLADNFEVYPKTNGTVEMNFTFHWLTIPVINEE